MLKNIPVILTFLHAITTSLARHNVTVNDTDPAIQYEGMVGDASLCKYNADGTFTPGQAGCYNVPSNCTSSAAMGQDKNGAASFTFRGSAIYVNSLLYDLSPIYTVTLDGKAIDVDGVRPSGPFICDTLFSQTGLDVNINHKIRLSIKDLSPNRNMTVGNDSYIFSLINFIYTTVDSTPTPTPALTPTPTSTPASSASRPTTGSVVGSSAAVGLIVTMAVVLLFY